MIPARAKNSQASFKRLKKQLSLWENSLKDEFYENSEAFFNIYHTRKNTDDELTSEERNDLTEITEADERYFQWYMQQSKPALVVYRGDGRAVDEESFPNVPFADMPPGGTRDISFFGVVQHTHTNTFKNGMVSTSVNHDVGHHYATDSHNFGVVWEMRVNNYIHIADLLRARNFKDRYPGQFEALIPGAVPASTIVSATLYNKNRLVSRRTT